MTKRVPSAPLKQKMCCVFLVLGFLATFVGAGQETGKARNLTETLGHGGIERTYHIHLPPDFNEEKAAPLVLALHGGGGQGKRFDE